MVSQRLKFKHHLWNYHQTLAGSFILSSLRSSTHTWMHFLKTKWSHHHSQPSWGRLVSLLTKLLGSCLTLPSAGYYCFGSGLSRSTVLSILFLGWVEIFRHLLFFFLTLHIHSKIVTLFCFCRFWYILKSQHNEWNVHGYYQVERASRRNKEGR